MNNIFLSTTHYILFTSFYYIIWYQTSSNPSSLASRGDERRVWKFEDAMTWSATKAPRGVPGNFDARTGISSDGSGDGFHMCFFNGLRMGY